MTLAGIDVSHWNGEVDWCVAAQSVSFAFARATEGASVVDPRFTRNWTGMLTAGLTRGASHRFDPAADAAAQAELFLRTVETLPSDLAPVLDIDLLKRARLEQTVAGMEHWIDCVQEATGRTPLVYTTSGTWNHLRDPARPANAPLWIAHYGVPAPRIPTAWDTWTFWQFSQLGRCAGIQGHVQMNRFRGSLADLNFPGDCFAKKDSALRAD